MHKLGTTLIYTELAHAALAADLFGETALQTYNHAQREWVSSFYRTVEIDWDSFEDAKKWRIVIDTEEKVQWFVPQVGDEGYAFDNEGEKKHGEFRGGDIIANTMTLFNTPSHMISFLMFSNNPPPVIEKRNGKPFPTPQEVRHD